MVVRTLCCLFVVSSLLVTGCLDRSIDPDYEGDIESESSAVTRFAWDSGNVTGPMAVQIQVKPVEPIECKSLRGNSVNRNNHPVSIFVNLDQEYLGNQTAWVTNRIDHLHVGAVDGRPDEGQDSGISAGSSSNVTLRFEDEGYLLFSYAQLVPWPGDHSFEPRFEDGNNTFIFEMECDGPFEYELYAGREFFGFHDHWGARGGVGASLLFSSLTIGDEFTVGFTSPEIWFFAETDNNLGATWGSFELEGPQGSEQWTIDPGQNKRITHQGPPGEYTGRIEWYNALGPTFNGVLLGMHPVDHWDEVHDLATL